MQDGSFGEVIVFSSLDDGKLLSVEEVSAHHQQFVSCGLKKYPQILAALEGLEKDGLIERRKELFGKATVLKTTFFLKPGGNPNGQTFLDILRQLVR